VTEPIACHTPALPFSTGFKAATSRKRSSPWNQL
jgi:hypothetical protein